MSEQRKIRPRVRLALMAGLSASILAVGSAAAVPPEKFPLPIGALTDSSCGYDIDVTFPVNEEFGISFVDYDGEPTKFIVAGNLVATFTNATTGETLTSNISGPSLSNAHGAQGTGLWALWPDGVLSIMAGRSDFDAGTFTGRVLINVCEALAP